MVITVHLHTRLQRQTPTGPQQNLELSVPQGTILKDLLDQLHVPYEEDAVFLVVNGRQVDINQPLKDGDEVDLIPAISGG